MKNYTSLLLASLFLISGNAFAECRHISTNELDIAQKTPGINASRFEQIRIAPSEALINVDPDAVQIGQPITIASTTIPQVATLVCSGPTHGTVTYDLTGAKPTSIANVFETNVPGIGFKLLAKDNPLPRIVNVSPDPDPNKLVFFNFNNPASFSVQLIKTGENIPSHSVVLLGPVASVHGDDGVPTASISVRAITVNVLPSCHVETPSQNIDFGTFSFRDFHGEFAQQRPFSVQLHCSGPTLPQGVQASLKAQADTVDAQMIRNEGSAQHLAIHVKDASTSKDLDPAGRNVLTLSNPGKDPRFDLIAEVKRIGAVPVAGSINATATILLSIN
ncbi:fimbrial protein [Paraburkholderia aspalathi]|uniref:fimbrial protein n=1 Tax=Paraburkholderia aspalathi TaxID=1324617 RepID=UPI0038BBCF9F